MPLLDANLAEQLRAHFSKLVRPVEFVAAVDDSPAGQKMNMLCEELAALSPNLSYRLETNADDRVPSFSVGLKGEPARIRFAGNPMGHEFTSLILAILQTGGHPSKLTEDQVASINRIEGPLNFEVFMSLSCHNCPDVVQALNVMATLNPNIRTTIIDGGIFPEEAKERQVMAVPTVFLNGEFFFSGRRELAEILPELDASSVEASREQINAKAPFDLLVVGAGPAGATAAIYAARKGLRTGMLAQRLGGQVNETAMIDNLTGTPNLSGQQLAQRLENHVREYDVDIMTPFVAKALSRDKTTGLWHVTLDNDAQLKSKTVVIATGAKWKKLGIPGENELMAKGVCFCPHCDGPLFKGKHVVVIGGGNSGVEAAIDLAEITKHVTLIHRRNTMTADVVLQERLKKLPNVTLQLNALTERFIEKDGKLAGIVFKDRITGEEKTLDCEGVFIQIGLDPNTEWLEGTVELSQHQEIVITDKGATSAPGVFAAGDCTTVPFKQIVTALGQGASAALGAFDFLIRETN